MATAVARAEVDTGPVDSPDPGRVSNRRAALGWGLAAVGLSVLTLVLVHVGGGSSRISLATMLFLSLAGLPPLAGFFAKFYVFLAAMQAGLVWPAVLGVLASAIGLVYYLRLVKVMFFDEAADALDGQAALGSRTIMVLSGAVALLFIFVASPVLNAADAAAKALLP